MQCDRCGSEAVLDVNIKHSDRFFAKFKGTKHRGYAPDVENICGGDYTNPAICLECGKTQGDFPVDIPEQLDPDLFECDSCGHRLTSQEIYLHAPCERSECFGSMVRES